MQVEARQRQRWPSLAISLWADPSWPPGLNGRSGKRKLIPPKGRSVPWSSH